MNKQEKEKMQRIIEIIDEVEKGVKEDLKNPKLKRDETGIVSGTCRAIKIKILLDKKSQKQDKKQ
jgi:hypothetical protein